jgi:glycosyltransferase involved in cell wall biosynthesis
MPVHNGRAFLAQSISSILNQTFQDYEFVIFDDGSTDGSGDIIREWALRDRELKLLKVAIAPAFLRAATAAFHTSLTWLYIGVMRLSRHDYESLIQILSVSLWESKLVSTRLMVFA